MTIRFRYGSRDIADGREDGVVPSVSVYENDARAPTVSVVFATTSADGKHTHYRTEFWRDGKLHRTDGPAVMSSDGGFEYWVDGTLHRDGDKPAIRRMRPAIRRMRPASSASSSGYVSGLRRDHVLRGGQGYANANADADANANANAMVVSEEAWFVNGKLHRDNGEPAYVDYVAGIRQWIVDGALHRDGDKPASMFGPFDNPHFPTSYSLSGYTFTENYFAHGKLHRGNGEPAVIEYRLVLKDDVPVEHEEGYNPNDDNDPSRHDRVTTKREWWENGVRHNTNGPAVQADGCYEYFVRGEYARKDGPAKFTARGHGAFNAIKAEYALDGKLYPITDLRELARKESPDLKRSVAYTMFEMTHGFKIGLLSAHVTPHNGSVIFPDEPSHPARGATPVGKTTRKRKAA